MRYPVAYRLVKGADNTVDINGFKSQAYLVTLKTASPLGQDSELTLNAGLQTSPTQPGLPTANILPALNGRSLQS